jgi:hypothetical protein
MDTTPAILTDSSIEVSLIDIAASVLPAGLTARQCRDRLEQRRLEAVRLAVKARPGQGDDPRRARFLERRIRPADLATLASLVESAVVRGATECQVLQFPAAWTSDRGRAINEAEPGWESTLTGFAAAIRDYFAGELRPRGFVLRAQIVTWPEGLPGDIGLFIGW